MSNFMKIRPVGAEMFHEDGRTDMTTPIVAFRNSAMVPKSSFNLCDTRGVFRPRQTRQLPRAVDLKGPLLSCQSY